MEAVKKQAAGIQTESIGVATRTPSVTNILAADLLIVDERVAIPSSQELLQISPSLRDKYARLDNHLKALLAKSGHHYGDKISITEEEFRELSAITAGLPSKMEPGGATADVMTTIERLRGDQVNVDMLGIAGIDGRHDNLILGDLKNTTIHVDPGAVEGAKSALSFIFTHPDGKHTVVTYPGNADKKLTPEMITDARIANSNTVFIPISLWSKFSADFPETLLKKAQAQDKETIVFMPKQARFEYTGSEDLHRRLITSADIIVADEAELTRWYKTDGDIQAAVTKLQQDLTQRDQLRAAAGKSPRNQPVVAFVKHADDSATVMVAHSATTEAQRYHVNAPEAVSGKKHTLGVDDAMYAGFIAALHSGLAPQQAGEYAMDVAQTKFLYDSVRIPGPEGADQATKARWHKLKSELTPLEQLGSAIGYAKTGIPNDPQINQPRTAGQKAFDFILYPLIANIGVFALSMYVTYHSSFNQNKANWFVKRSSWFKEQLTKVPKLGESPQMVRNLNMVIWSFIDGSLMAPVVAAFESKRQHISHWIDERMGTAPDDTSVYEKEIKRNWADVLKARATTFAFVIGTYFALNAKIFPNSTKEGILNEVKNNAQLTSGVFEREGVQSINGMIFDVPAKNLGGWLSKFPSVENWARKISDRQLKGLAKKTGTTARVATAQDARYQIEGIVNTGLFEAVYTSLCTAGLFFIGKAFASKRNAEKRVIPSEEIASGQGAADAPPADTQAELRYDEPVSWVKKSAEKMRPEKVANYIEAVDKTRNEPVQLGA